LGGIVLHGAVGLDFCEEGKAKEDSECDSEVGRRRGRFHKGSILLLNYRIGNEKIVIGY
jgi:hypothetical protein